jgi:diguanylate cyclase (GGDEF)-like protein
MFLGEQPIWLHIVDIDFYSICLYDVISSAYEYESWEQWPMEKLSHHRGFVLTFLIIFISMIVLLPSLLIFNFIRAKLIASEQRSAINLSVAIAKLVATDIDAYRALAALDEYTPGSYDEAYYQKMLTEFRDLKANSDALYIYTAKKVSDDEMVYVLDAEDPASDNFSPLGSLDSMNDFLSRPYSSLKADAGGMYHDDPWGYLLTGVAPIIDPVTGQVISVVGTDMDAAGIQSVIYSIGALILLDSLLIIVILGFVLNKVLAIAFESVDTDFLTGLHTKFYHQREIRRALKVARRSSDHLSLLMIDLDGFKEINDKYGHLFGDYVLKEVGQTLKSATRSIDKCSRFGGDEFVIILPGAGDFNASAICERIVEGLAGIELSPDGQAKVKISASLGAASYQPWMTVETLTDCADQALYQSKKLGKNQYTIWHTFR